MSVSTEALLRNDRILLIWELRALFLTGMFYFLSAATYFRWFLTPRLKIGETASRLCLVASVGNTLALMLHAWRAGRLPCMDLYEVLLMLALLTAIVNLVVERRIRGIFLGSFSTIAVVTVACFLGLFTGDMIVAATPPIFLQGWFRCHCLLSLVAFSLCIVAFSIELGYLFVTVPFRREKVLKYGRDTETLARFHRMAHQLVLFAFPFLSAGLIVGAIWAEQAVGRYWPPGSNHALLVTWIVYAMYLHSMTATGWRGGLASTLNIAGFASLVVTIGVMGWH